MTLAEHFDALTAAEVADDMIAANRHIEALITEKAISAADIQAKARLLVKMMGEGDDDEARLARSMLGVLPTQL